MRVGRRQARALQGERDCGGMSGCPRENQSAVVPGLAELGLRARPELADALQGLWAPTAAEKAGQGRAGMGAGGPGHGRQQNLETSRVLDPGPPGLSSANKMLVG